MCQMSGNIRKSYRDRESIRGRSSRLWIYAWEMADRDRITTPIPFAKPVGGGVGHARQRYGQDKRERCKDSQGLLLHVLSEDGGDLET